MFGLAGRSVIDFCVHSRHNRQCSKCPWYCTAASRVCVVSQYQSYTTKSENDKIRYAVPMELPLDHGTAASFPHAHEFLKGAEIARESLTDCPVICLFPALICLYLGRANVCRSCHRQCDQLQRWSRWIRVCGTSTEARRMLSQMSKKKTVRLCSEKVYVVCWTRRSM